MWRTEQHAVQNIKGLSKKKHFSILQTGAVLMKMRKKTPVYQSFNGSEELKRAAHFPHVRLFTVALRHSETQQADLKAVELPWSVPTAGPSAAHSLTLFTKLMLCLWLFECTKMHKWLFSAIEVVYLNNCKAIISNP